MVVGGSGGTGGPRAELLLPDIDGAVKSEVHDAVVKERRGWASSCPQKRVTQGQQRRGDAVAGGGIGRS
jgi:hypothetical protein